MHTDLSYEKGLFFITHEARTVSDSGTLERRRIIPGDIKRRSFIGRTVLHPLKRSSSVRGLDNSSHSKDVKMRSSVGRKDKPLSRSMSVQHFAQTEEEEKEKSKSLGKTWRSSPAIHEEEEKKKSFLSRAFSLKKHKKTTKKIPIGRVFS